MRGLGGINIRAWHETSGLLSIAKDGKKWGNMGNASSSSKAEPGEKLLRGSLSDASFQAVKASWATLNVEGAGKLREKFLALFELSAVGKGAPEASRFHVANGLWRELETDPDSNGRVDLNAFCRLVETVFFKSLRVRCRFLRRVYLQDHEHTMRPKEAARLLMQTGFYCLADTFEDCLGDEDLNAVSDRLKITKTLSDKEDLNDWMVYEFPFLVCTLSVFVEVKLGLSVESFRLPTRLPLLRGQKGANLLRPADVAILSLAIFSAHPEENCSGEEGTIKQLYDSRSEGLGFNRLVNSVIGYAGPTIIVIRDQEGHIFGAYTAEEWRRSKEYYGTEDCFLFTLSPHVSILRPRQGGERKFQYLCDKDLAPNSTHGLGFGGDIHFTRFFLSSSLSKPGCTARESGLTFQMGSIGGEDELFEPIQIEIWGCGGKEAEKAQQQCRSDRAKFIAQRRKVDKSQFLDGFSQEYLLGGTFKHKEEVSNRGGE